MWKEAWHLPAFVPGLFCFSGISDTSFYDAHLVPVLQPPTLSRFWCSVTYNMHNNICIVCRPKPQQTCFMMYLRDCQLSPHTAFLLTPACPGDYFPPSLTGWCCYVLSSGKVSDKDWTYLISYRLREESCLLAQFPEIFSRVEPHPL